MAAKKADKKAPQEPENRPSGRRHPGLEEAWKSSAPGPRPLVAFLAAGVLVLMTLLVAGFTWGAHALGVPVALALPVLVMLLLGGFLLLQRSVKD